MHPVLERRILIRRQQAGIVGNRRAQRLDPRPIAFGEVRQHVAVHQFLDAGMTDSYSYAAIIVAAMRRDRTQPVVPSDAAAALYGRAKRLHWRVVRIVFGWLGRVPPALINSNALVLTAAWHRYEAKDHDLPLIMFNALERPAEFRYDETLGWRACVSRPCTIHFVPGDHYTLLRPPHAQVLAECLVPYLNQPRNMAA